jgi:O-methyltransferase involved in polyketide biosynthesis
LVEEAGNPQLVIAGAGFDALGIAVAELYTHVKVFELDEENMNVKSRLATAYSITEWPSWHIYEQY